MMRGLLKGIVSFRMKSYGMEVCVASIPGKAKGTAAAFVLKKVRPKAAIERQCMVMMEVG